MCSNIFGMGATLQRLARRWAHRVGRKSVIRPPATMQPMRSSTQGGASVLHECTKFSRARCGQLDPASEPFPGPLVPAGDVSAGSGSELPPRCEPSRSAWPPPPASAPTSPTPAPARSMRPALEAAAAWKSRLAQHPSPREGQFGGICAPAVRPDAAAGSELQAAAAANNAVGRGAAPLAAAAAIMRPY